LFSIIPSFYNDGTSTTYNIYTFNDWNESGKFITTVSDLDAAYNYVAGIFSTNSFPSATLSRPYRNIHYLDGYDDTFFTDTNEQPSQPAQPLLIKNMCFVFENIKRCFYSANNSSMRIQANPDNDIFIIVHEDMNQFPSAFYQSKADNKYRVFLSTCNWRWKYQYTN
jgi:hypothetical protein